MNKRKNEKGFTLIELIFSFLLVLLALLFIGRIFIFSFDGYRKSRIRLEISQKLESCKNELLSKSFNAKVLEDGHYSAVEGMFKINRDIKSISPTLKEIKFSISYKTLTRQIYFYKSKFIKEVKNG